MSSPKLKKFKQAICWCTIHSKIRYSSNTTSNARKHFQHDAPLLSGNFNPFFICLAADQSSVWVKDFLCTSSLLHLWVVPAQEGHPHGCVATMHRTGRQKVGRIWTRGSTHGVVEETGHFQHFPAISWGHWQNTPNLTPRNQVNTQKRSKQWS